LKSAATIALLSIAVGAVAATAGAAMLPAGVRLYSSSPSTFFSLGGERRGRRETKEERGNELMIGRSWRNSCCWIYGQGSYDDERSSDQEFGDYR